jgi:Ca-activated chloride channel family protein
MVQQIIRALCWGILGVGLGAGVSLFVPNFPKKRAMLAGFIGGTIGGYICNFVGALPGAFILGLFIGLTISILEEAMREAWLTVVWGPKEARNISLGERPVIFGTAPEADIYVPDPDKSHNPIRAIFKLENNRVVIEDPSSGRRSEPENGKQINMGKMSIIVNMKKDNAVN